MADRPARTIRMWSEAQKAEADWNLTQETENDAGGNAHLVLIARSGDEVMRFSPNHSDEEMDMYVKRANARQSHDMNAPLPGGLY